VTESVRAIGLVVSGCDLSQVFRGVGKAGPLFFVRLRSVEAAMRFPRPSSVVQGSRIGEHTSYSNTQDRVKQEDMIFSLMRDQEGFADASNSLGLLR
jgi:hypothetical protein